MAGFSAIKIHLEKNHFSNFNLFPEVRAPR
jgi:hypothetical protein